MKIYIYNLIPIIEKKREKNIIGKKYEIIKIIFDKKLCF